MQQQDDNDNLFDIQLVISDNGYFIFYQITNQLISIWSTQDITRQPIISADNNSSTAADDGGLDSNEIQINDGFNNNDKNEQEEQVLIWLGLILGLLLLSFIGYIIIKKKRKSNEFLPSPTHMQRSTIYSMESTKTTGNHNSDDFNESECDDLKMSKS